MEQKYGAKKKSKKKREGGGKVHNHSNVSISISINIGNLGLITICNDKLTFHRNLMPSQFAAMN